MAHRYHINPNTGRVGQCRAQSPETCQFSIDSGTIVQHYDSADDARAAYEKMHEHETVGGVLRKKVNEKDKRDYLKKETAHKKAVTEVKQKLRKFKDFISRYEKLDADLKGQLNIEAVKKKRVETESKLEKLEKDYTQYKKDHSNVAAAILRDQQDKERAEIARRQAAYAASSCGGASSWASC